MSRTRFFPYRTAPESIEMEVITEVGGIDTRNGNSIDLSALSDVNFELELKILAPSQPSWCLVPEHERQDPPIDACIVLSSMASRQRVAHCISPALPTHAAITLDRSLWQGTVELEVVLLRNTKANRRQIGFAFDQGARLAWSPVVRLYLDQPPSMPGSHIPIEWISFSQNPRDAWTPPYSDYLFHLDTTGDKPKIFLNQDIPGAVAYLQSEGTHGEKARVRDSVNATIAHQGWSSLLGTAIDAVMDVSSDGVSLTSVDDILDQLSEWQSIILRDWAKHIYPGYDHDDAIEILLEASAQLQSRKTLVTELIPAAIQRRLKTPSGLKGFVMERY